MTRLLHEITISPGSDPATLVVRRADVTERPSLTLVFLSEHEAGQVLQRTSKQRSKLQRALDLLEFPGTRLQPLEPTVFQVAVDDRVVARGDRQTEISVKAARRNSTIGFLAQSPMGIVSGRVALEDLMVGGGRGPRLGAALLLPDGDGDSDGDGDGDGDGDSDGDGQSPSTSSFGVEVKFRVERRRRPLGVWLAATAVVVIAAVAVASIDVPCLVFTAVLAVRVAVAASRRDFSLSISSCTVVERQPATPLAPTPSVPDNHPAFSRSLSVEHALSLRRSIVDRLDKSMDQLELEAQEETIARLNEISPAINDDLFKRYVAACKGDVSRALSRLEETARWRKANDVDNILDDQHLPYFSSLKKHYVHALIGRTRDGLPILVEGMGGFGKAVGNFRAAGIMPDHNDQIIKQFILVMEYIFKVVEPTAYPKGQFLRIYDLRGIKLAEIADSEAVNLGYEMMQMLENHYCERMARAIVIAPPIFSTLWKMIKGLVDPSTAEKITVVKPSKLLDALRKEMDDDVIPKCWGGNGCDDWYEHEMEKRLSATVAANGRSACDRTAVA